MLMIKRIPALFVTLLIVCSTLFNGCATQKTRVAAYPGYFEIPANTELTVTVLGSDQPVKIKTDRIYYSFDQETEGDFLSARKGK